MLTAPFNVADWGRKGRSKKVRGVEVPSLSCSVWFSQNTDKLFWVTSSSRATYFRNTPTIRSLERSAAQGNWPILSVLMLPNSRDSSVWRSHYERVRSHIALVKDCINEGVEGRRGNCAKQQKSTPRRNNLLFIIWQSGGINVGGNGSGMKGGGCQSLQ